MIRACALAGLAVVLSGCPRPIAAWKGTVEWPENDERSVTTLISPVEAGAALAAAGAIRELIKTNTEPRVFWGCSSPEQGLDVVVSIGAKDRADAFWIGITSTRSPPQGEVVAKAPPSPPDSLPPSHPLRRGADYQELTSVCCCFQGS
jgi:hypothetical protein